MVKDEFYTWAEHVEARYAGQQGFPVVEVFWNDARAQAVSSWETALVYEPILVTTVGYLINDDKVALTVVSMIYDTHCGHAITIPRGCLVGEIRYLS